MEKVGFVLFCSFILGTKLLFAQSIILTNEKLKPVGVSAITKQLAGKTVLKVIKDSAIRESDEPTFAIIKGINFSNGTIEVNVLSRLLPNAPAHARGFIGVAFRVSDDNTRFESIYLRPTNGRSDVQLRRNRSVQYFSYPDYKFDRLRKEAPGEYETYADMGLNEWVKLKIVVNGSRALLYLNNNIQPTLIVNDLKLGFSASGAIGLWVDVGTEGYFSDLKIKPLNISSKK